MENTTTEKKPATGACGHVLGAAPCELQNPTAPGSLTYCSSDCAAEALKAAAEEQKEECAREAMMSFVADCANAAKRIGGSDQQIIDRAAVLVTLASGMAAREIRTYTVDLLDDTTGHVKN